MRQLFQEQLALLGPVVKHPHVRDLTGVDRIIRSNPRMAELVLQDLQRGLGAPGSGRRGLTAEQVLRCAVLKQLNTWTYDELSFRGVSSPKTPRPEDGTGIGAG